MTSPTDGSTVGVRKVPLVSIASGSAPASVSYYDIGGNGTYDKYLGYAYRAADGTYTLAYDFGGDGMHQVYAIDGSVKSTPVSFTVAGTLPDVLAIASPPDGGTTNIRKVPLVASAQAFQPDYVSFYEGDPNDNQYDKYLGYAYRGTDGKYTKPYDWGGDGTHTVYAAASDGTAPVRIVPSTFTVAGTTPDSVTITSPANGSTTSQRALPVVAVTAGFQPDYLSYYLGDPADTGYHKYLGYAYRAADGTYSLTYDFGADGTYQVYATADDGTAPVHANASTFTIGGVAADVVTMTNPANGSTISTHKVPLTAVASGFQPDYAYFYEGDPNNAGAARYLAYVKRGADGTYVLLYDFGGDGTHQVFATATDGNAPVSVVSTSFTISGSQPDTLTMTAPADGSTFNARTVTLTATAQNFQPDYVSFYDGDPTDTVADHYIGYAYRLPDGTYSKAFDFGGNGAHQVYAVAVDAQFTITSGAVRFTISGIAESLAITSPANGSTVSTNQVSLSASSDGFTPASVAFYEHPSSGNDTLLGTSNGAGFYTLTGVPLANGPHQVYAQATDGTNTVRSPIITFTVDTGIVAGSLTLGAPSLASCSTITGTVTLSNKAPAGGAAVKLASDSPSVVLPSQVIVPVDATSAGFTITGMPVRLPTLVTISATFNGATKTATLTVTPYPHFTYIVQDLQTFGGAQSAAYGINASGQATGYAQTEAGANRGFRTDAAGAVSEVDTGIAPGYVGYAINASGQVAGATLEGTASRAFATDGSGTHFLTNPLGGAADAAGVNASGIVSGSMADPTGAYLAFRTDDTGDPIPLGPFSDGTYSYGFGINDAGQVAGYGDTGGKDHAFRAEPDDSLTDLKTLSGTVSYGYAINGAGQVTGAATGSDGLYHIFRTNTADHMDDLGHLDIHHTTGRSINTAGEIVGYSFDYDTGGSATIGSAVLYADGTGLRDLNTTIDPASGWTLRDAEAINDAGQIAGWGVHNGAVHAFRLTLSVPKALYGDADGNGVVDLNDVLTLAKVAAGLAATTHFAESDVAPAPACNARGFGDGRIDLQDALRVLRRLDNLEAVWP